MSRDIAPLGLRMAADLKDRVAEAAHGNGRSMNAEIVARLEASFEPLGREGEFTAQQWSVLHLLASFARLSVETAPPTDDKAVMRARRTIYDFASKVIHSDSRRADYLMQEFSVLAAMLMTDLMGRTASQEPCHLDAVSKPPPVYDTSEKEEACAASPAMPAEPPRRRMNLKRPKKDPSSP